MKKIPISMNDEEYRSAEALAQRFGMNRDIYGWFPKTIKASIRLNLLFLDLFASFIPVINDAEMDFLLQSVKVSCKRRNVLESAQKAQQEANRYNHQLLKSIGDIIPKPE